MQVELSKLQQIYRELSIEDPIKFKSEIDATQTKNMLMT